jgi:hypothetical protein
MGGACSTHGGRSVVYMFLVGKDDGKGLLGKPWSRWEESNKRIFKKSFRMAWTAFMWPKTRTRG